jgi:hypothetical protein
MDRFEDGAIEITAADLPSFLYKTGTIYDPENEVEGRFRSFLLIRVSPFFSRCQNCPGLSSYLYWSSIGIKPAGERWDEK